MYTISEARHERTVNLLGREALDILKKSKVIIFGVGGVGGYVAEALARCGVGSIDLVDKDVVSESNINRQIIASYDTIGQNKTEVMKKRILSVNPEAKVKIYNMFYLPDNSDEIDLSAYNYVVDAVDTVTAKIEIIVNSKKCGVPVISSMGTGSKLNPAGFCVSDISKTSVCPLAKVMRRELKKREITDVKVIYSKEEPVSKLQVPGSVAFVPSAAGLLIASEVIKDLTS